MPLTSQDQQAILAAQNAYRTDPAINAPNLQWDSTLATGAQTWADNLATNVHQLQHSDPSMRQGLGENIASATTGSNTLAQMVDFWGKTVVNGRSEQAQFKPGIFSNVSKDGGTVGHYTQMIWKTTTNVGCGVATDSTTGNTYLICRYSPQGNMSGVGVPPPQPISLVQVSCGSAANICGVDAANNAYLYTATGTTWTQTQMPSQMKQVSAAADNTIWGLDPNGMIWNFNWNTFSWTQMPGGPLAQLSCVSATNIWGVGNDNSIWQYTTAWARIGSTLKQVSAASDGTVWGVGMDNNVYSYMPSTGWAKLTNNPFVQLAVGSATNAWGVKADGTLWQYNGSSWSQSGSSQTKQVSVASDGTLWTVNHDGPNAK